MKTVFSLLFLEQDTSVLWSLCLRKRAYYFYKLFLCSVPLIIVFFRNEYFSKWNFMQKDVSKEQFRHAFPRILNLIPYNLNVFGVLCVYRVNHADKNDVYDIGVILLEIILGRQIKSQNEVHVSRDLVSTFSSFQWHLTITSKNRLKSSS